MARKEMLYHSNEKVRDIFILINQLSHNKMHRAQDEEFMNLINLAMKYWEFQSLLIYTYDKDHGKHTRKLKVKYAYFSRISLTFCYQFYDKLGLYIKNRYSIATESTYFKENVKVLKGPVSQLDTIAQLCRDIDDSEEYNELNAIRQVISHKNKWINYESSSEQISSLLIGNFAKLYELMYMILEDYFDKYDMMVSDQAIEEIAQKMRGRKL